MAVAALCHLCGRPALRTCANCGRPACEVHLARDRIPVCESCRAGRITGRGRPGVRG
ncbi:MAG TPA: hypothetical protein VJ326_06470 [Thermoplasmata archaeon]|nr:hypothetical protein [Thermoplasmata archaeon]